MLSESDEHILVNQVERITVPMIIVVWSAKFTF